MQEQVDKLYQEYLKEKLDLVFNVEDKAEKKEEKIVKQAKKENQTRLDSSYKKIKRYKKWNFKNSKGQLLSPKLWFDYAFDFSNGFTAVAKDGKYNYINTEGQILSPNLWFDDLSQFENGSFFENGYAGVKKDGKWNYINTKGEILSPNLWFDAIWDTFENGYAGVKKDDKWNYINTEGKIISSNWFDSLGKITKFQDGFAAVEKDGKMNYINTDGKIISPNLWFDDTYLPYFQSGYACVKKDGKYNYIDKNGKLLIPSLWFDEASEFSNGCARVKPEDGIRWNYINTKGRIISPNLWFDEASEFSNGCARVKNDGKWNYINTEGQVISPNLWFDDANVFQNGYACVKKDGKWNYINTEGKIISSNWFDNIGNKTKFQNGVAAVTKDGKWNYINTKGQLLNPNLWFDEGWDFQNGVAAVKKDGKWNYINTKGQLLNPNLWFDEGWDFQNGYARVKKNGKWNYININGNVINDKWYKEIIHMEWNNEYFAVLKSLGINNVICTKTDFKDYKIQRKILGYECNNGFDIFKVKYEPIKIFGVRYTLCLDKENVVLFDRVAKDYTNLGDIRDIEFDNNFIFDNKNDKVYLVYENIIKDITEYYNKYLKDKKIVSVNKGVTGILSREEFALSNMKKIDELIEREKRRNDDIKKQLEKEQRKKEKEKQKRRLEEENRHIAEQKKNEMDEIQKKKLESLRKISEELKKIRDLNIQDISFPKEKINNIFIAKDDHIEIDSTYQNILKLIDLALVSFNNVKVSGIDFQDTNIDISKTSLNPQTVYKNDLSNCNFEGIHISPLVVFDGVDIRGSKFSRDKDIKTADFIPDFTKAIYDENTTYNGIPVSEIIKESKKVTK